MSSGGVFESTDGGGDWHPLNKGVRARLPARRPIPSSDTIRTACGWHPRNPDRLYQQNHCGIYRLDRPAERWHATSARHAQVGRRRSAFRWSLHPRDPDTLWVFPMDGTDVWPRVSPGGKPAAYRTVNGGKTWQRQADGHAEVAGVVDRQAAGDDGGSMRRQRAFTSARPRGEVWGSRDEGRNWKCLAEHLPHIYAVECA